MTAISFQQQQRPDLSRLLQMQAGGAGGLPPGFPGSGLPGLGGLPPGLAGLPASSGAGGVSSLLAGMPPTSSAAALAHMMAGAGARLPGPLPHGGMAELYAEKEKELAKLSALQGPLSSQSEDRNVSILTTRDTPGPVVLSPSLQRRSLSPSREHRAKSPGDRRSPDPKKLKKDEVITVHSS